MSINDMDDYAVNLADAYAKDAYQKGYEQGGKDAIKHGHWSLIYEVPSGNYFKCSECNHEIFLKLGWKVSDEYRYCSGCGARMDGE